MSMSLHQQLHDLGLKNPLNDKMFGFNENTKEKGR